MSKLITFIAFIVGCLLVGFIGSFFTASSIPAWYATLNKPIFSPPNWLFGPVWTVLYVLMGVSAFLVFQKGLKKKSVRDGLRLFAVQLFLNAIWSPVFFGAKNIFLALIIIILLWFYIVKTIKAFAKVDKTASYLLYPYIAWVSFATILNFSLLILN